MSAPPPSTGAAPSSAPSIQLSKYITDQAGVLAPAGRIAVERAIDKLYADRNVRLWVA
ncbi:MAG TPA: serine/threonine protein kinase, partial [Mycobacterium sp.]|nr:serine/threonine protein kinase [Mycobacterium sp.]